MNFPFGDPHLTDQRPAAPVLRVAHLTDDIWWNEADKGQALYGKKYSLGQLGLATPYYSFEKGGWKFIVLDSDLPLYFFSRIDPAGAGDQPRKEKDL